MVYNGSQADSPKTTMVIGEHGPSTFGSTPWRCPPEQSRWCGGDSPPFSIDYIPQKILESFPYHPQLLFVVKDPADRAWSNYKHFSGGGGGCVLEEGIERKTRSFCFDQAVRRQVKSFKACVGEANKNDLDTLIECAFAVGAGRGGVGWGAARRGDCETRVRRPPALG